MASRRERRALKALLESGNDKTREAFLEAVADIVDGSDVQRIIRALERNDLDGALRALNIQDEAFQIVAERVAETYVSGGRITAQGLSAVRLSQTGLRAIIRFDARNLEAERWLADMSSRLIKDIADKERQSVREALRRGLEAGDNPRRTALDIVGRVQRGSNRRSGGILGLTGPQKGHVASMRKLLSSGDPADLRMYLRKNKFTKRDKRFDRTVAKAIREGKPLTQAQIDQIAGRYSDRLLKLRADTISRTETLQALQSSRYESYRQAIDSGDVDADAITKTWKDSRDGRVRISHSALHNEKAAFNDVFISPLGSMLRYPGDVSLGARSADIIQCRCFCEYRIAFEKGVS